MKTDPIFQEKYQELQLQMAMHLLSQKELEEAEEEFSKLNGQPEFAPTPQEEEWIMGINNYVDLNLKHNINAKTLIVYLDEKEDLSSWIEQDHIAAIISSEERIYFVDSSIEVSNASCTFSSAWVGCNPSISPEIVSGRNLQQEANNEALCPEQIILADGSKIDGSKLIGSIVSVPVEQYDYSAVFEEGQEYPVVADSTIFSYTIVGTYKKWFPHYQIMIFIQVLPMLRQCLNMKMAIFIITNRITISI